jgi:dipeptidyl aminopeptidase/acylaminoacyl peptidase
MRSLLYRGLSLAVLGFVAFSPPLYANPANSLGAPPPLEVYSRLPRIDSVTVAPDGKKVAYIQREDNLQSLVQYSFVTQKFETLNIPVDNELIKRPYVRWADNDSVVFVTSQLTDLPEFEGDKNQFTTATLVNIDKRTTYILFSNIDGFYPIVSGPLDRFNIEGNNYLTAASYRLFNTRADGLTEYLTTPQKSVFSINPQNKKFKLINNLSINTDEWALSPEGEIIARSEYDSNNRIWTLRYKDGNSWRIIYTQKGALDRPNLIGLGKDGKSLVIYLYDGEKGRGFFEVSPEGILSAPLETKGTLIEAQFHPLKRNLVGFSDTGPNGKFYNFFDPEMTKLVNRVTKSFPNQTTKRIINTSDDLSKVIVYAESAEDAGSYYYIDFTGKTSEVIGSERPDLPMGWIAKKSKINYKASDGLEINGFLTLPPGRNPHNLPLIVLPHGGPQSHDNIEFDWLSQAIASRGYAVFQPNFRGSTGYGVEFTEAGYGEWGRKMQTDLSDGVRYLAKEGIIDPRRVCIFGWSYGGYAALAGASMDTGVYKCAASIAGVSNLKAMVNWESKEAGFDRKSSSVLYWKRFMGDESRWDEISPDLQASKVDIPVLLIHGKDDDVVPVEQSYRMRDALLKLKKPVEFVFLKAEDHSLSG